jgi:hypothetical protein
MSSGRLAAVLLGTLLVVAVVLLVTGAISDAMFPYDDNAPCESPAIGRPGGCLLPAGR